MGETRISVGALITLPSDEIADGYEIIKSELEAVGIVVDNKGPVSTQESVDQILEFVLKIASDPATHHALRTGAEFAGKALLTAGGSAAAKAVVDKAVSGGNTSFANIIKRFKERFSNRTTQIMVEAPTGVLYPLPVDDPDEAVAQIPADMEKPRQIAERFRHWEGGQWMTADESREARNKPK